jgi:hypothetical protein
MAISKKLGEDANWKPSAGGIIAEAPENFADVKKDVGRAAQTVALGLGPVSGGAAFGAGASLEQGNDLFSKETLAQTALGAGAGKVLGIIGKPLINAAGKVVGKITPEVIKDVASQGTKAVQEFAARHQILPEEISKVLNTVPGRVETAINKPFDVAGGMIKKPFVKTPESIIKAREQELGAIDNNYVNMRKASGFSKDAGVSSRRRIAQTDVLVDAVDENGLIRTENAVKQYEAQTLDQAEGVVRKNLERLGETVDLKTVEKKLVDQVNKSGLEGADLKNALNKIKGDIAGYKLRAKNGKIPLTLLHDAKVSQYKQINFQTPPETSTYRKAVARGLKETVEESSKFNAKEVNDEIGKYLEDVAFLRRLDGKRVKGGKLGKYFAQISGNIIGGTAGAAIGGPVGSAVGTIVGGELGGRIKGSLLQRTLGGRAGYTAPKNKIIEKAVKLSKTPYENNLGNRNTKYNSTANPSKGSIDRSISSLKPKSKLPKLGGIENEAKKYKTAEEFVKAQGTPVFRGVMKGTKEFSPSSSGAFNEYGFSVSADKKVANKYRAGGGVIEGYIEPKAKIKIEPNQFGDKEPGYMLDIEKVKQAKKEGYDGYTFTNKDGELETLIFNKEIIKTKSQLTDIWNKANNK